MFSSSNPSSPPFISSLDLVRELRLAHDLIATTTQSEIGHHPLLRQYWDAYLGCSRRLFDTASHILDPSLPRDQIQSPAEELLKRLEALPATRISDPLITARLRQEISMLKASRCALERMMLASTIGDVVASSAHKAVRTVLVLLVIITSTLISIPMTLFNKFIATVSGLWAGLSAAIRIIITFVATFFPVPIRLNYFPDYVSTCKQPSSTSQPGSISMPPFFEAAHPVGSGATTRRRFVMKPGHIQAGPKTVNDSE